MTTASLLRPGADDDVEACVQVWLEALEARDAAPPRPGTADRSRAKLGAPRVSFVVASTASGLDGFVLVGAPGSGFAADPPRAAYLSLLAVRPASQGRGLARLLLATAERESASVADEIVLHVLADNTGARALYSAAGWSELGPVAAHPLSGAPMLTLRRSLRP